MARIWRRVKDKRVLHLIRRYFAGWGHAQRRGDRDGRRERRKAAHSLRYSPTLCSTTSTNCWSSGAIDRSAAHAADDCNIFHVRSQRAGERVMSSVRHFIEGRFFLGLKINESKSKVDRPRNRKFLGFSFFRRHGIRMRVASKSLSCFKSRVRELTARSNGWSMERRIYALRIYLRGWMQYFRLAETPKVYRELDSWVLHRLRLCQWKQMEAPTDPASQASSVEAHREDDARKLAGSR